MSLKQHALLAPIAAGLCAALIAVPAFAAAPMATAQAPGFHHIMVGSFQITPLSDGTIDLPVNQLLQEKADKVDAALAESFLKSPLETSDNAYLVNTGSKLILIDTGAGGLFGPTLGRLVANRKSAGYQPGQVHEIYITHFHADHVGGLVADGQLVFPNAVVRADKKEAEFWLSEENMNNAPPELKDFFLGAMASLKPYDQAGKFEPFEGDVELAPGIRSHSGRGHTPGHMSYMVESEGQKLLLIGDLMHVAAVQMKDPSVTIAFDLDPKAAEAARKQVFDDAAKEGYLIGGAHLQFPGLGHLRAHGKGYRFYPVNYTRLR